MIKRRIVETIEEYDDTGRIVKKTTTETTEDDDTAYVPYYPYQFPGSTGTNPIVTYKTESTLAN